MGGKCIFNDEWIKKYSWLKRVQNDKRSAFCKVCNKQFKIKSRGENDVITHSNGTQHMEKAANTSTSMQLTRFLMVSIGDLICI